MKQPTVWLRLDGITLVGYLLMLLLLSACTTPFIAVDVKVACPQGEAGGGSEDGSGVGACKTPIPYTGIDAFNLYNTEAKANITDHNHSCTGAAWKCQALSGSCYIGGPACKSYFTPSPAGSLTGTCNCGCPP